MSIDSLPVEILDKVLFYGDMRDRMNMRLVNREIERKIAGTRYHHFKKCRNEEKTWYEYDDVELECSHKNPKRFTINFGKRVRMVNVHSSKREELTSLRWSLFDSFRVDRVVLKVVNFNTIPISFIEDFLDKCFFRSMVIVVTEDGWHRSLLPFLHTHSSKIEELLVCNALLPNLVQLPRLKLLAATPGKSIKDEAFLRLLDAGHKRLTISAACHNENTLLHAFLTIADSPIYQEVEFDVEWEVSKNFLKLIESFFNLITKNFEPTKNNDFDVRNTMLDTPFGEFNAVSIVHGTALMIITSEPGYLRSGFWAQPHAKFPFGPTRARIVTLLEERTWDEAKTN